MLVSLESRRNSQLLSRNFHGKKSICQTYLRYFVRVLSKEIFEMKLLGFCVASVHGLALNSTVTEDVAPLANSQVLVMSKNPPFSISWPFGATEPIIATYDNFNYNGFYVKQVCSATLNGRTYLFGGGTSIEDPQRQQVARVRGDMTGLDILSAQLPFPMVEHSCTAVRSKWIMLCGTADTVSGEFRYE